LYRASGGGCQSGGRAPERVHGANHRDADRCERGDEPGKLATVKALLKAGADVNANKTSHVTHNALYFAKMQLYPTIVSALRAAGATSE